MSINADVEVTRAKLMPPQKAIPMLMGMVEKGNMSAAIALKELKDRQDMQEAMQRQAGISTNLPAGSVLSGLAAEIEAQRAPMPTTQMYAEGGEVEDADGYLPGENPLERAGRRISGLVPSMDSVRNFLRMTAQEAPRAGAGRGNVNPANADTQLPSESPDGLALAAALKAQELPSQSEDGKALAKLLTNYKKPVAAKPKAGLAAAVEPEVSAEARADDREPRPSLQGQAAAVPQTPEDIYLAKLEKLREDGKKLSAEQQKLLDEAHAKTKERLKGDGIWGILRNISAQAGTKNGGRALNAFAAGTREYNQQEKDRKGLVDKADDLYAQNTLLLKKADLLAAEGDLKGAYELRNQAAKNAQEAALKKSQTRVYNAQADAKPVEAAARTVAASGRLRGTGPKGAMTQKDWLNQENKVRARLDGLVRQGLLEPEEVEARVEMAMQKARAGDGAATIPGNAKPGATTGAKFLGFE